MRSRIFWTAWVGLLAASGVARGDEPARRPDIVLFLADDLGWADCSIFGGRDVPTPNMERLAKAGMTFNHAFVASPSCAPSRAPSRAALLTGLDPMRNGAMRNHARPRMDIKTWPAYFHDLGYEVAAIGKTAHYAQVTTYGFDHTSHHTYHDDACVPAAVEWLKGRKSSKPLCLIVGTNWPHVPWPAQPALKPADVALPPTLVNTPATRQARAKYAHAVAHADRDLGLIYDAALRYLPADSLFLFSSDHGSQFPFGKWNCYDAGLRTPLIVAWPGRVAPGSKADAMVSWVDLLPTLLDAGGPAPPGLDGRSLLGVLEGKTDQHRDRVFATHSADGVMNRYPIRAFRTRDRKYIRNLDPASEHTTHVDRGNAGADGRNYFDSWVERAKPDPTAAAIVARYHHRPAEELYDLEADPLEQHNLAADPAHAATLAELRGAVDARMKGQGDEGMATERALLAP